ncbi:hypothetical protein JQ038_14325 [Clostridium botulinum]|nr:hypothetical protein [Clostridium botulinum]
MLYLLIAMWIYQEVPEKLLMVLAMIFGAHLMPYGWLYKSKTYISMSVFIPIVVLIIGLNFKPHIIAAIMILFQIVFSLLLMVEIKN